MASAVSCLGVAGTLERDPAVRLRSCQQGCRPQPSSSAGSGVNRRICPNPAKSARTRSGAAVECLVGEPPEDTGGTRLAEIGGGEAGGANLTLGKRHK
jgi:hypothetical protein